MISLDQAKMDWNAVHGSMDTKSSLPLRKIRVRHFIGDVYQNKKACDSLS